MPARRKNAEKMARGPYKTGVPIKPFETMFVITLRDRENWAFGDIADQLGISTQAANWRYYKWRKWAEAQPEHDPGARFAADVLREIENANRRTFRTWVEREGKAAAEIYADAARKRAERAGGGR